MASWKSEHPVGNLPKTWFWHRGRTAWFLNGFQTCGRRSRSSAAPATGSSAQGTLLIQLLQMLHPSGDLFATDLLLAHLCIGLPVANHKLRVELDAESQSVNPNPPQTIGDSKDGCQALQACSSKASLTTLYSLFRGDCCHKSAAGTGVIPYEYCLCQLLRKLTQPPPGQYSDLV